MTGIILLNKPKGITSFLAVAKVRRISGEKKAGHTGTLDPMATGVLPIMLGGATRFCELLPSHDKGYKAKFMLGLKTDTLDITGRELERHEVTSSKEDVENALKGFVGEIEQLPPMYSAILKDGVRLYELARKGIEVEREKRKITIYSAAIVAGNEETHEYEMEITCSAGTYVRTLVSDIGDMLGCAATLTELSRTVANGFNISECVTIEELERLRDEGKINKVVIPVEKALCDYPEVSVTQAQANRFKNGGELDISRLKIGKALGNYNVFSPENEFLGLGEITAESDTLNVKRVYVPR